MVKLNYHGKQGDEYHKVRHVEIFDNERLLKNWGDYSDYRYFSNVKNNSKILEIGAGTGINMVSLKNRADVSIVEPSDYARKHCTSMGLVGYKTVTDVPEGLKFDFIFMRHVLEHLNQPFEMLLTLKKLLKQNGTLIIIVPIESGRKKYSKHDIDHHLYCWNQQTLQNLLQEGGYTIQKSYTNSFDGRRIFSIIKKLFGNKAYYTAMEVLGKIMKKSEIVIEAKYA